MIRKDGNMRRVWQLVDNKRRNIVGEVSRRMRQEFDCKQERYRSLGISGHAKPMAGGEILKSLGEDKEWREVPPNTPVEDIFRIVCAK